MTSALLAEKKKRSYREATKVSQLSLRKQRRHSPSL